MTTLISRDPFARTELHRAHVYKSDYYNNGGIFLNCRWCGNVKTTPKGRGFLFQYSQESDGGSKSNIPGLFCSIDCMRSYHS